MSPYPLGHPRAALSIHTGHRAWGAGTVQWGWGSTGCGKEAGAHLALEVHVRHVAADSSVSLVPTPILLGVLEATLTQGALMASALYIAHMDGPQT